MVEVMSSASDFIDAFVKYLELKAAHKSGESWDVKVAKDNAAQSLDRFVASKIDEALKRK